MQDPRKIVLSVLMVGVAMVGLTGCGPSVWERSFSFEPEAAAAPVATIKPANVVVRDAPWGRVGPALEAERQRLVASDTHREDWSADRARESKLAILRELQLPFEAANAELLGRSHFRTTQPTDPDSPELRSFAASVGADYVVWSKHVVGKVETVEREPVQSNRWRTSRVWDADRKRYDYERRWGPETVWVPVVVEREQVRWVVFYLRQR
ncbi:MAG: hypothetical protein HND58_02770 [Planctomycetota bacterium]|nr:MAG: hypothetical protein HND58_02770 [Planctomycetota bacterium]